MPRRLATIIHPGTCPTFDETKYMCMYTYRIYVFVLISICRSVHASAHVYVYTSSYSCVCVCLLTYIYVPRYAGHCSFPSVALLALVICMIHICLSICIDLCTMVHVLNIYICIYLCICSTDIHSTTPFLPFRLSHPTYIHTVSASTSNCDSTGRVRWWAGPSRSTC
jgi:hypothetical protein